MLKNQKKENRIIFLFGLYFFFHGFFPFHVKNKNRVFRPSGPYINWLSLLRFSISKFMDSSTSFWVE
tara:strand:+ start:612 stop:812 length:201 start_codon:yes stop_codon:yes gene_type:complete